MAPQSPTVEPFESSNEKKIVRTHFDRPLLTLFKQQTDDDHGLRYFGLAGPYAQDIGDWIDLFSHVTNVDFDEDKLQTFEDTMITRYSDLDYLSIVGDVDSVIIRGESLPQTHGQFEEPVPVRILYDPLSKTRFWAYNVLNLDYYGSLLPDHEVDDRTIGERLRDRATAWTTLFERTRIDARHPWLLMITTQAVPSEEDQSSLRQWVIDAAEGHGAEVLAQAELIIDDSGPADIAGAKLVHAVIGLYIESCTNPGLKWRPRRTITYLGGKESELPMAHAVFEFYPDETEDLPTPSTRPIDALTAPVFRVRSDRPPYFELVDGPWDKQTIISDGGQDFLAPEAWS